MYRPVLFLFIVLTLAGCLPSSCQRQESRALFGPDSLSRERAAVVPADTLRLAWQRTGTEAHPLAYPRTVAFGPDGRLYVGDVERNSVFVFAEDGTFVEEITSDAFSVPYLAGFRGDTVVVLNPEALRLDLVVAGAVARRVEIPAAPVHAALVYAAAADSAFYFKQVGQEADGFLLRFDNAGRETARFPLSGPYWRYAGLLRTWGDSLVSLSGFRPVADVVVGQAARLDTMALVGFDSPMLARSRSFMLGEVGEAPLLSTAAAAFEDRLYALNLRPGWLQVDAYDHAGLLQRRLIQANPAMQQKFFPQDLAVRRHADGTYLLAVVFKEPAPRLDLYTFP